MADYLFRSDSGVLYVLYCRSNSDAFDNSYWFSCNWIADIKAAVSCFFKTGTEMSVSAIIMGGLIFVILFGGVFYGVMKMKKGG